MPSLPRRAGWSADDERRRSHVYWEELLRQDRCARAVWGRLHNVATVLARAAEFSRTASTISPTAATAEPTLPTSTPPAPNSFPPASATSPPSFRPNPLGPIISPVRFETFDGFEPLNLTPQGLGTCYCDQDACAVSCGAYVPPLTGHLGRAGNSSHGRRECVQT